MPKIVRYPIYAILTEWQKSNRFLSKVWHAGKINTQKKCHLFSFYKSQPRGFKNRELMFYAELIHYGNKYKGSSE